MEDPKKPTEEELFASAKSLMSNGHRFSFIYKYLRDRSEDADSNK